MTAKLGILLRDIQDAQGVEGWFDHVRALIDLGVEGRRRQGRSRAGSRCPPSRPEPTSAQDLVLRDLGWDLGEPAIIPSLWFPET